MFNTKVSYSYNLFLIFKWLNCMDIPIPIGFHEYSDKLFEYSIIYISFIIIIYLLVVI